MDLGNHPCMDIEIDLGRPRKTLEKHVVKNVVDDLLAKSCVVPHFTMHKKVDNALLDIFENVTNEVKVHVKKPNLSQSMLVVRVRGML